MLAFLLDLARHALSGPGDSSRSRGTAYGQPRLQQRSLRVSAELYYSEHRVRSKVLLFPPSRPTSRGGVLTLLGMIVDSFLHLDLGTPAFYRLGFHRPFLGVRSPGNARCFLFLQPAALRGRRLQCFTDLFVSFSPFRAVRAGLMSDSLDCAFQ